MEFSSGRDVEKKNLKVNKKVIIPGGTVNSPQILQLSGIGPGEVLKAAGVGVNLDLAGVGMHLQEHLVCMSVILSHFVLIDLGLLFVLECWCTF